MYFYLQSYIYIYIYIYIWAAAFGLSALGGVAPGVSAWVRVVRGGLSAWLGVAGGGLSLGVRNLAAGELWHPLPRVVLPWELKIL